MIRIAICDDEQEHLSMIHEQISEIMAELQEACNIAPFSSSVKLMASPLTYNIIFLDLNLEHGIDGINIARSLRRNGYSQVIIIITSMKGRSYDGYHAKALRFIQKPFSKEELTEAMTASLAEIKNSPDKIIIKFKGAIDYLSIDSIYYIENYYGKRAVHTEHGIYETNQRLAGLISQLPSIQFYNANRSFLINLKQIKRVNHYDVVMNNGQVIKFSRGTKKDFDNRFHAFIGGTKHDNLHVKL